MESYKTNAGLAGWMASIIFVALSVWWIFIAFFLGSKDLSANLLWAASYQLMALFGAICGLIVSRSWGGSKSAVGKAILFFSGGLLLQVFGQSVFSFYNLFLRVEVPYPSIADVGFFFSIPLYAYGAFLLGKMSGAHLSLKSLRKKIEAFIIPFLVLVASYMVFLRGYQFDWSRPLTILLDFGYPLGQATYVSLALLVFLLSKNFLGGLMRPKILLILLALVAQYVADYNFLYQASNQTWINGGYGDYIYLFAYFIMAMALVNLGSVFEKIKNT